MLKKKLLSLMTAFALCFTLTSTVNAQETQLLVAKEETQKSDFEENYGPLIPVGAIIAAVSLSGAAIYLVDKVRKK